MLDLYIAIVPIFGLLGVLTLYSLKSTLIQPKAKDLQKYEQKKQGKQQQNIHLQKVKNKLQPGYLKTLSYLLKNYTVAQFCCTRRSRNKLILLSSTLMIALLTFLVVKTPFIFCFIGGAIVISYTLGKMLTNQQDNTQHQQTNLNQVKQIKQEKFQSKSQVFITSLSLLTNMVFLWFVYKNYNNVLLLSAIQNFFITLALDNFIVRPLILAVYAYPIRNIHFIDDFIDKQNQVAEIINEQRVIRRVHDAHISALSPKKMRNSPSKVPKAFQIQPRTDNKQNYTSSLDLIKSLKKPKLSPISLKKRNDINSQGQSSLISIFNSNQRKKNRNRNSSFDFDKSQFDQKVQQQDAIPQHSVQQQGNNGQQSSKFNFESRKKNKLYSSKLIMINQDQSIIHNLQNDIQNQQQQDANYNKSTLKQKSLKDSDVKSGGKNYDCLKVSLHNSIEDNNNNNHYFQQQQNDANYQIRPHSTLQQDNSILGPHTNIHSSRKNGLLKINQDKSGQDLQQIDLNSPQRRKQKLSKIVQDSNGQASKLKKKKPHKKYSLDPNRHVIKHSTGQPYLQFLPNLLNKQRDEKKKKMNQQSSQQVFSRKIQLMNGYTNQSRLVKSVKKQKNTKDPIVRQNDENRIPQFVIQDFN